MKSKSKTYLILFLWLLLFYFLCRSYFFIANYNIFKGFALGKILFSFLHGIRFDVSSLVLLNLLFTFFYFLPKPKIAYKKFYNLFLKLLFFIPNCLFIIGNIADSEYYTFSGKRSALDIFGFSQDIGDQFGNILLSFAPSVLFSLVLAFLFYKLTKKYFIEYDRSPIKITHQLAVFLLVTLLTIIGARGGLQSKVLRPAHAFIVGSTPLAHLTQNTTFTVLKSKFVNNLERIEFLAPSEVKKLIKIGDTQLDSDSDQIQSKVNIVIIALEGFSTNYWGYANESKGYTPFLDQLAQKGVYFKNHFANGRRSAEAFPALFMGLPSLGLSPLPMSQYINNKIWGLAHGLEPLGYDSQFFHGANYNSSYTHSSAKISGFKKLTSRADYPDPKDYNGHWGISDGPFLNFFADEMDKMSEPFVTGILTLSSHEPFELPAEYEESIPQLKPKILRTIIYTDKQMEKFFAYAKTKKWYKNTLFIITGDHTSQNVEFSSSTIGLGLYRVPMLFYTESNYLKLKKGSIEDKITQHIDLPKTIFSLLGIKDYKLAYFGRPMFSNEIPGRVLVRSSQIYWFASKDYIIKYFTPKTGREGFEVFENKNYYELGAPVSNHNPEVKKLIQELKAYIQYYNNSMLDNSIYL